MKKLILLLILVAFLIVMALPAMAAGPFHGRDDIRPLPPQKSIANHPNGCMSGLVLNAHGICTFPGWNVKPSPSWHRAGF